MVRIWVNWIGDDSILVHSISFHAARAYASLHFICVPLIVLSVRWLENSFRKFLFAQKRVPHDDQFLYFFVNVKFQVKLRGIVRTAKYMQWARHRAVHLRMKQKQLKTKRTCSKFGRRSKWHTHTARCQNNEYFTLNANILCVPVFIIKKFPSAPSMKCYFLPRLLWLQWSNRINSYRAWGNVHFFFFFLREHPKRKKARSHPIRSDVRHHQQ